MTDVEQGGNAASKGLKTGDIILELNQDSVSDPGQVASIVASVKEEGRKSVLVLFNRGGDRRFIVVPLDEKEK